MSLPFSNEDVRRVPIDISGAATTVIQAAVAGKCVRLLGFHAKVESAAITVQWQDTGGGNLSGAGNFPSVSDITLPVDPVGWVESGAGLGLRIVTTGTGILRGMATVLVGTP